MEILQQDNPMKYAVREETLFAGIRAPIKSREDLIPRIQVVTHACADLVQGPLVHIFRFDTPVEGYDSEIGFPVASEVNQGDVRTHTLRRMHFFSMIHLGPLETLRETTLQIFEHMKRTGLSSELELMEIYHHYDPKNPDENRIETCASFLAWPEVYEEQLLRVLGPELTAEIWEGGEQITPFTLVDPRAEWVAESLRRLKTHTTAEQQFDILSRVALMRPVEDILKYKKVYDQTRDINTLIEILTANLKDSPNGGPIDPWWFENNVLHQSKVAANREAYDTAKTHQEIRKAYCFCALIREATDPKVDPIFCYRAAGWARQFWEPILGTEFKQCKITHSILQGDPFCAWDTIVESA